MKVCDHKVSAWYFSPVTAHSMNRRMKELFPLSRKGKQWMKNDRYPNDADG